MQIHFRTKEESNRAQEEEFLKLSPSERFYAFIKLMHDLRDFPSNSSEEEMKEKENFVIEIKFRSK